MASGTGGARVAAGAIVVAVLIGAALRSCGDEADVPAPPTRSPSATVPAPSAPVRPARATAPKATDSVATEPAAPKPTCRLRVRVVGGEPPEPIAGASIDVLSGESRSGVTGADGEATFESVAAQRVTIIGRAPGWARGDTHLTTQEGEDAAVELRLVRGAAIELTVQDAATGAPIADSGIDLETRLGGDDEQVWTGPDGRATVWMEPSSALVVTAGRDGYIRSTTTARTGLVGGPPVAVTFRLLRAGTLRGCVRYSASTPIAEAEVVLTDASADPDDGDPYRIERSVERDGTFTIEGLVPGRAYTCQAEREGFAPSAPVRVVIDPATNEATCELTLRSLVRVTATVSAANDEPVGTHRIHVESEGASSTWSGGEPSRDFIVEPGPCTVVVKAEGFAPAWREFVVEGDEDSVHLPFVLERGAEIRGVVVDENDRPIDGATVTTRPFDADTCPPGVGDLESAQTGDDGGFVFGALRRRPHDVQAWHPDFDPAPAERLAAPSQEARFVLRRSARLRFRVLWNDAEEHDGSLFVLGLSASGEPFVVVVQRTRIEDVDVAWPRDAAPQVQVTSDGYERVAATAAATIGGDFDLGEVRMRRAALRGIAGSIRLSDGSPAAGAQVRLTQSGSHFNSADQTADPSGSFAFEGASPDACTLTISHARAPRTEFAVPAGAASRLELDLPPAGLLRVQATDARGYPVPCVAVTVRDARGRWTNEDEPQTDERGGADWVVAPGVWTVETKAGTKTAEVRAGEIALVEVVVR